MGTKDRNKKDILCRKLEKMITKISQHDYYPRAVSDCSISDYIAIFFGCLVISVVLVAVIVIAGLFYIAIIIATELFRRYEWLCIPIRK